MDTARVLEDPGSSSRRPSRHRRWILAAALAALAAPLASGSANAVGGSSSASSGGGLPTVQEGWTAYGPRHHDGRKPCQRGKKGAARGSRPDV